MEGQGQRVSASVISCAVDAALEPRRESDRRLKSRVYETPETNEGPRALSIIFFYRTSLIAAVKSTQVVLK